MYLILLLNTIVYYACKFREIIFILYYRFQNDEQQKKCFKR